MGALRTLSLIGCLSSAAQPLAGQSRDGYVTVADSVRLHYRIVGLGPDTIVVLHGGPGLSLDYLAPDLGQLAARHTVIFYDQRGSGESTAPFDTTHINLSRHLADLDAIRAHFHIARLTILGHSWGGKLAVIYAKAYPDRVARLILEAPGSPMPDPRFARNLTAWADSTMLSHLAQLRRAADDSSGNPIEACRAFWKVFIRGYWSNPNDSASIGTMRGNVCAHVGSMRALSRVSQLTLLSVGGQDYAADLGAIRVPVLVVTGRQDPMPWENSQAWAAALPGARLLIVEQSGHFPHIEHPRLFFEAIETFLGGQWPPAAVTVQGRRP